jgi:hypothetical protein
MVALIGVVILIILLIPYFRVDKYEEIKRQQSMRKAMYKVQEKHRHFSS